MSQWRDERIAKILDDAGLSSVHWQSLLDNDGSYRCDMVSREFTESDLMSKLRSVEKQYDLISINTFKPEWNKDIEAHAHFKVNLK